ncbi:coiled-coil domain-containing protein 97 isoform X2 [Alligator mississippiensis]|uniref:coiled-coil domain-containing protein 97 isoform X2 n=1 Tax=Alligator mississippiensis TaxID=8496 RepID=UPI002877FBD9|nr:coiled-coil domain-containing protein 97 isoform X2 [Alligator mississippiensis]
MDPHRDPGSAALAGPPPPGATSSAEQPPPPGSHWGEIAEDEPPEGAQEEPPEPGDAVQAMLAAVASSPLPVCSQQRGEPELTAGEKRALLEALYRQKPGLFLERFHRALRPPHLGCFAHLAGRYDVAFYCGEVQRAARQAHARTRTRNRRYAALQQLIRDGEYFSRGAMRARAPLLYQQYVGRYLSEAERRQELAQDRAREREQAGGCLLAGALLDCYQEQELLRAQQEQEEACREEEDEDEDSEEDEESEEDPDAWVPSAAEKAFLRQEFTSRMHQHFLDGRDGDFDYSAVDDNPELDDLDMVARDEEERYFDDEEPGPALDP